MVKIVENDSLCINCMAEKGPVTVCPYCHFAESELPEKPLHLPARTILKSRYIVGRVLFESPSSITYTGYDVREERRVSIREYCPATLVLRAGDLLQLIIADPVKLPDFDFGLRKFTEESVALAAVKAQPGFAHVIDYFQENNTIYRVNLQPAGRRLSGMFENDEYLDLLPKLHVVFKPLLLVLEQLHAQGLLHYALTPENIIISDDNIATLVNFSGTDAVMALHLNALDDFFQRNYAPPEFFTDIENASPAADVYAFGAILFQLMTGKPLPPESHRRDDFPLKEKVLPGVHKGLLKTVARAIISDPAKRIGHIGQLRIELAETLAASAKHARDAFTYVDCNHCGIMNEVLSTDLESGISTCFACDEPLIISNVVKEKSARQTIHPPDKPFALKATGNIFFEVHRKAPSDADEFTTVYCPVCRAQNDVLINELGTLAHCTTCGSTLPENAEEVVEEFDLSLTDLLKESPPPAAAPATPATEEAVEEDAGDPDYETTPDLEAAEPEVPGVEEISATQNREITTLDDETEPEAHPVADHTAEQIPDFTPEQVADDAKAADAATISDEHVSESESEAVAESTAPAETADGDSLDAADVAAVEMAETEQQDTETAENEAVLQDGISDAKIDSTDNIIEDIATEDADLAAQTEDTETTGLSPDPQVAADVAPAEPTADLPETAEEDEPVSQEREGPLGKLSPVEAEFEDKLKFEDEIPPGDESETELEAPEIIPSETGQPSADEVDSGTGEFPLPVIDKIDLPEKDDRRRDADSDSTESPVAGIPQKSTPLSGDIDDILENELKLDAFEAQDTAPAFAPETVEDTPPPVAESPAAETTGTEISDDIPEEPADKPFADVELSVSRRKVLWVWLATAALIMVFAAAGFYYWQQQETAEADRLFEEYVQKGDMFFEQKNYSSAAINYQRALYYHPDAAYPHQKLLLAQDMMKAELQQDALNNNLDVPEREFSLRDALFRRADSLAAIGDVDAAGSLYQQILRDFPNDSLAALRLAEINRRVASNPTTTGNSRKPEEYTARPGDDLAALMASAVPFAVIRLERGIYEIGEPIVLRYDVQLEGVGASFTTLVSREGSPILEIVNGAKVTLRKIGFNRQTARENAMIEVSDGELILSEGEFRDVQAVVQGGTYSAICFHQKSRGDVRESKFTNHAVAISVTENAAPVLEKNEFWQNASALLVTGSARPKVRGNQIRRNLGDAVIIREQAQPMLEENIITENRGNGILFQTDRFSGNIRQNKISENSGIGVLLDLSSQPILEKNEIALNKSGGILVQGNAQGILRENTVERNNIFGFRIANAAAPQLQRNIIKNNTGDGIEVLNQSKPVIQGNEILQNRGDGISLLITQNGGLVQNNTCRSNQGYGISILKSARPNMVNNTLAGNYEGDIYEEDKE